MVHPIGINKIADELHVVHKSRSTSCETLKVNLKNQINSAVDSQLIPIPPIVTSNDKELILEVGSCGEIIPFSGRKSYSNRDKYIKSDTKVNYKGIENPVTPIQGEDNELFESEDNNEFNFHELSAIVAKRNASTKVCSVKKLLPFLVSYLAVVFFVFGLIFLTMTPLLLLPIFVFPMGNSSFMIQMMLTAAVLAIVFIFTGLFIKECGNGKLRSSMDHHSCEI